jgi:hypothetical protein
VSEANRATEGKKKWKRPQKPKDSASQPMPHRHLEKLPDPWCTMHWLGEPILPSHVIGKMTGSMRHVHYTVLHLEIELLLIKYTTYPLLVAKVPTSMGFVETNPSRMILIRLDDIFNIFHMKRLHRTVVQIVALSMASKIIRDGTPRVAIMDPFYVLESVLRVPGDWVIVKKQIEDFLVDNYKKEVILIPYFPE